MKFLEDLAARRRFGMKPGLETISAVCAALGDPQRRIRPVHVAGTNGKGAVCAMLDACLRRAGLRTGRYTSPHLIRINERFFLDGAPLDDATLDSAAARVAKAAPPDLTFFEALTAVAFLVYAEAGCDEVVLETGLGGRLDATNICEPELCVITRIGLDHCDWLGGTVEAIAAEKGGIIKSGVPVVLGENLPSVQAVIRDIAREKGAPFFYAPSLVSAVEIPATFSLGGSFNRENAVTALAALKVLRKGSPDGLAEVAWPGRFQRVGGIIVDGAHNPPAARALVAALRELPGADEQRFTLVAGFCGDKDVDATLRILAPLASRGIATRTGNPRSLAPDALAAKMEAAGIPASSAASPEEALAAARAAPRALVCGSLFLAGEALVALGAFPWSAARRDPSELLKSEG